MHVVREPDSEALQAFLRNSLAALKSGKGPLVEVFGSCTVVYAGRAASTLDQGERLVMIKPDGTLLVHTGAKAKPVNWMPAGDNRFSVETDGDRVVLVAVRKRPHDESVRITFDDVQLMVSVHLRDAQELVLRRTEGDLHALFYSHPELIEEGLVFHRGEKDTRRGPVDLWGTDRHGNRVLVEVKRSKGGIGEATQLWRYVEMERNGRYSAENGGGTVTETAIRIRGILVCPGLSDKAKLMLTDHGLEHVDIDWDRFLAHLDAPPAQGQATLGRFMDGSGLKDGEHEKTVRTGKRRKG